MAVLEDAGLALFAVDDEVLRRARRRTARRPLHRRRKIRAAAPGETRRAYLLDDQLGPGALECQHQRRVRPVADGVGDVPGVGEAAALEEHPPLARQPLAGCSSSAAAGFAEIGRAHV